MSQNPRNSESNSTNDRATSVRSGSTTKGSSARQYREEQAAARRERERHEREAAQRQRLLITIGMVIVVILIIVGGTFLILNTKNDNSSTASNSNSQPTNVPATAAAATTGSSASGVPAVSGDTVTTPSGLKYIDSVVGTGPSPTKGQQVTVNYTGYLENGTKFDSSVDRNQPFPFNIGVSKVIAGWDEGVMTMKVGGKRRLIIPSNLGYGASGAGASIPPNATLIFDVELLSVG